MRQVFLQAALIAPVLVCSYAPEDPQADASVCLGFQPFRDPDPKTMQAYTVHPAVMAALHRACDWRAGGDGRVEASWQEPLSGTSWWGDEVRRGGRVRLQFNRQGESLAQAYVAALVPQATARWSALRLNQVMLPSPQVEPASEVPEPPRRRARL